MDRNGLQPVHNATNSQVGVILTHFCLDWWAHPIGFEAIWTPKTAKEAKMGRISDKRGFQGPLCNMQMLAKYIYALCQWAPAAFFLNIIISYTCRVVGRLSSA